MAVKKQTDVNGILYDEVYVAEACAVGILWSHPSVFSYYKQEKLNENHFGNKVWQFYFRVGKFMFEKGLQVFDDISTLQAIKEMNVESMFEEFGGYETIEEIMEEQKDDEKVDNLEAYYDEIKKYSLLRHFYDLFGRKVLKKQGKYDYKKLDRIQLEKYWSARLDKIILDNSDVNIVAYDLLEGLEEFIADLDENSDQGMPFHKSERFSEIINGWAYGTLGLYTSFSGNGKTSWMVEKIILGCIENNERLLIIANEMDLRAYRKYLLVTIMGTELYKRFAKHHKDKTFKRKHINIGKFTEEEKEKLKWAIEWVNSHTKGNNSLIKFVPLEHYTMQNVEAILRYWARLDYRRVVVDTAKPSDGRGDKQRWEQFVDDMEQLYKLVRADGGLNLACFCTAQNADNCKSYRMLDERVIGDGKKIKNVCDFVFHTRSVFEDELADGKNELTIKPQIDSPKKEWFTLDLDRNYFLLFTSKNRRGATTNTGLPCLVYQVDFNRNEWREIGWTTVLNDLI
jgi:replicative DNA helicase